MPSRPIATGARRTVASRNADERAVREMRRRREWRRGWIPAPVASDKAAGVMATGAVSLAAEAEHYRLLGLVFGVLASAGFAVVAATAIRRGRGGPPRVEPDCTLWAFSFVAAGALLATRWHGAAPALGWTLGLAAGLAWLLLARRAVEVLSASSITELRRHARGRWLLASVAPQSLAIAAAESSRGLAVGRLVTIVAFSSWILGMVAYLGLAGLIVGRATARRSLPQGPDAWILMGALAIATVAASAIAATGTTGPGWCAAVAHPAIPVLWVLASAWVPVLLVGQRRRILAALRHDAARWAAVFPLGMYSIASSRLAGDLHQSALRALALTFFWVALAAWVAAAVTPHLRRTGTV